MRQAAMRQGAAAFPAARAVHGIAKSGCTDMYGDACVVCASVVQVVAVAAGEGTCYALTYAGEVFAWGQGSKGQLGTGECDAGP